MPARKMTKRKTGEEESDSLSSAATLKKAKSSESTKEDDGEEVNTKTTTSEETTTTTTKKEVERTKQTSIKAMFKKASSSTSSSKSSSDKAGDDADKSKASGNDTDDIDYSKLKYKREDFTTASNGQEHNFKIVTWNVNGIRAWIEHDGLDYVLAEDPDIFCCQETKCDKSKIPPRVELPKYHCYWLSGDTQGYSGVGLMSKVKPLKVSYGLGEPKFDDEGRMIIAEYEKFTLINTYIPNSSRGLVRLPYRMEWEKAFRAKLSSLESQKPIIWCGDLNVAHEEIDLKNPKTNAKTAGFTQEERDCFTNVLSDGYFDSFRHLYPTKADAYTFWSYMRNSRQANVGWRIDYFVMSEKLKPMLVDNVIRSSVTGSDHCPVSLFLKI